MYFLPFSLLNLEVSFLQPGHILSSLLSTEPGHVVSYHLSTEPQHDMHFPPFSISSPDMSFLPLSRRNLDVTYIFFPYLYIARLTFSLLNPDMT
jgi:hypothetical protein